MRRGKIVAIGIENIPEKGTRFGGDKYGFAELNVGDAIDFSPDENDEVDLKGFKKRIMLAAKGYEKRLGRVAKGEFKGEKVKDFAIWIDEAEGVVMVGLRSDYSAEVEAAPEPDKRVDKKKKPAAKKPAKPVTDLTELT